MRIKVVFFLLSMALVAPSAAKAQGDDSNFYGKITGIDNAVEQIDTIISTLTKPLKKQKDLLLKQRNVDLSTVGRLLVNAQDKLPPNLLYSDTSLEEVVNPGHVSCSYKATLEENTLIIKIMNEKGPVITYRTTSLKKDGLLGPIRMALGKNGVNLFAALSAMAEDNQDPSEGPALSQVSVSLTLNPKGELSYLQLDGLSTEYRHQFDPKYKGRPPHYKCYGGAFFNITNPVTTESF